ncbi:Csu type fimbrial protein [Paraburkholderia sp. ZP32-5]|uniref:Csu type fimbrial protein n=1 Tax=Paraburkholderia sp. ZP32-5 TaxID=2883245 RepID=UPI001F38C32E|nr:spore coat protein U domain-containing protein [Paraburkholderia sp. ZP32-5]
MKNNHALPRKLLIASLAGLALVAAAPVAAASGTAQGVLGVSADVTASCSVGASTDIALSDLSFAADGAGQGAVNITCTTGTSYNVGLDQGGATGATVTTRKLTIDDQSGATLAYSLTTDQQGQTNWGDTVGTDTVPGTGNGATQSIPVYMQIRAADLQAAVVGHYSDTVNVTVTY